MRVATGRVAPDWAGRIFSPAVALYVVRPVVVGSVVISVSIATAIILAGPIGTPAIIASSAVFEMAGWGS